MIRYIQLGAKDRILKMLRSSGTVCTADFAPRPVRGGRIPEK
jgi:hypothetical protein